MNSLRITNLRNPACLILLVSFLLASFSFGQTARSLVASNFRGEIGLDGESFTYGLVIEGPGTTELLLRGVGPSLGVFGVPNFLPDPVLTVHDASGAVIAQNDDWNNDPDVTNVSNNVGAFPLFTDKDAAIVITLQPGVYSLQVAAKDTESGSALVEVYDAFSGTGRIASVTGLGRAGSAPNFIGGFSATGPSPQSFLIRSLGPSLGLVDLIPDPSIELFDISASILASNDDWGNSIANPEITTATEISGLSPLLDNSNDAAVLLDFNTPSPQTISIPANSDWVHFDIAHIEIDRALTFSPGLLSPLPDRQVPIGENTTLVALAVGRPYPAIQWFKDEVPLVGETSSSLTLVSFSTDDVGAYSVKLSSTAGTVYSTPANLTVAPALPQSVTLSLGESFDFVTGAKGSFVGGDLYFYGPPGFIVIPYLWANNVGQNGIKSLGDIGSTDLATVQATAGGYTRQRTTPVVGHTYISWLNDETSGEYAVFRVANSGGGSVSFDYEIISDVNSPLAILDQPDSVGYFYSPGITAEFFVGATGMGSISYQWRKDGIPIQDATNRRLELPNLQPSDAGNYDVIVSSDDGSLVSDTAELSLVLPSSPPVIEGQPVGSSLIVGDTLTMNVRASGTPSPTFQWILNGQPIDGAINSSYNLGSVTTSDAGNYQVIVSNSEGSILSDSVSVSIDRAPADLSFENLFQSHNGEPRSVSVITAPSGLDVVITYEGLTGPPTAPGGYSVTAVIDDEDYEGSVSGQLTITDDQPPVISLVSASPSILRPSNNKLVDVIINAEVSDLADPAPFVRIVSVSSNQPNKSQPDWIITGPLSAKLRATRAGRKTDRIYIITIEATDTSGNTSSRVVELTVPHDKRKDRSSQGGKSKGKSRKSEKSKKSDKR